MTDATPIYRLLYASRLAPPHTFNIFKSIIVAARTNNSANEITGALVFDGERFCQLLEGPQPGVSAL